MAGIWMKSQWMLLVGTAVLLQANRECHAQDDSAVPKKEVRMLQILLQDDGMDVHSRESLRVLVSPSDGNRQGDRTLLMESHPASPKGRLVPHAPVHDRRDGQPTFEQMLPGGAARSENRRPEVSPPVIHRPGIRAEILHRTDPHDADRNRIAALTESAERIAREGLPDVAHGLRERARQLERELAEQQERMQQEARQRSESQNRQSQERAQIDKGNDRLIQRNQPNRRTQVERDEHHEPGFRELQEQIEMLRREMHQLNERVEHLTDRMPRRRDRDRHRAHRRGGNRDDDDGDDEHDHDMEADE